MGIEELVRFNELAESCGNKYLAIKFISYNARMLGHETREYHLVDSKLIDWVLHGKCPYNSEEMLHRRIVENTDNVEEFLSWVEDTEVKDEVKRLYKLSVNKHYLMCCDNNNLSPGKVSRVNVLLRMLWYSA